VPDLAAALAVALHAVADARHLLLSECARPTGPRGDIGSCDADVEAETLIQTQLLRAFPTWGFIGEETGIQNPNALDNPVWIVDPNDGTTSMQRGYRGHAISVGLVHDELPVLGVVCAVDAPDDNGDLFAWARGCGPPRRNGVPLSGTAPPETLSAAHVVALSQGANRNPVGYGPCVAPARFVGLPSIAYRLALVAAGECAATLSLNPLSVWDYAAGHALVRGAGGVLVDANGVEVRYPWSDRSTTRRIFAGSPSVVRHLVAQPWDRAPGSGFGEVAPPPDLAPTRARPDSLIHDAEVLSRVQGCLLGQFTGDALGALVEFSSATDIVRRYPTGGPQRLADGGPHHILAGQPTDDSELALLLARRLVADGEYDAERVARAYVGWYRGSSHSDAPASCSSHPWCKPFDVGNSIAHALAAVTPDDVAANRAAERAAAAADAESQANGALMRVSPLGIWGAFRDPAIVADAARQDARLTHPHPICQDASAIFSITIAAAIGERLDAIQTHSYAVEWAKRHQLQPAVIEAIESAVLGPPTDFLTHSGWVLIALRNAFSQLVHAESAERGIVETVRAGGDTDTNAAICGALLGAVFGRDALPMQWQQMVETARPMPGWPNVQQPRPAIYWPIDVLVLAERLGASRNPNSANRGNTSATMYGNSSR
jgi:ADP-ribosylglycohydrolase/fructose-1,6-bisphosphatase/inositol monophosphatase family enzyme